MCPFPAHDTENGAPRTVVVQVREAPVASVTTWIPVYRQPPAWKAHGAFCG
jgi:hypothetical protein